MNFYDFWVVFVGAFYFSSSISGLYFVDCLPLFSLTTLHIRAVTYRTEEQRGVKAGHQPPPLFNPSPLTSRKGLNFYSTLGYLLFPLVSGIFFSPWAAEKNSGEKKNFGALRKRCFFSDGYRFLSVSPVFFFFLLRVFPLSFECGIDFYFPGHLKIGEGRRIKILEENWGNGGVYSFSQWNDPHRRWLIRCWWFHPRPADKNTSRAVVRHDNGPQENDSVKAQKHITAT